MLIAQLSDAHVMHPGAFLAGRFDLFGYLERAVDHICMMPRPPDVVLFTGDLVNDGTEDEYQRVRAELERLRRPVYIAPGNHDDRNVLRSVFPDQPPLSDGRFIQFAVEEHELRLIALDTIVPSASHGTLCQLRLDWLQERLSEVTRPTVLFMHHHPFPSGLPELDSTGIKEGNERLTDIVQSAPHVKLVLCGHVHRPIFGVWAGTAAVIGPSCAHQGTLDLRLDARHSFTMDPPAVALHLWENDRFCSHLSYIDAFPGPFSHD